MCRFTVGHRLVRVPLDFRITVDINVPADHVWAVIRDVESWPEWTPTVKKIRWLDKGSLAVGSGALIWQPKLLPAKWRVTELDDSRKSFGPGSCDDPMTHTQDHFAIGRIL